MHDPEVTLKKLFRIAIFSFAIMSGVGLSFLYGDTFSINWSPNISRFTAPAERMIASAGEGFVVIKDKLTPVDDSVLTIALLSPNDDLPRMRRVFEEASWKAGVRTMDFYKGKHIASGDEVLSHFSGDNSGMIDGTMGDSVFTYTKPSQRVVGHAEISVKDRTRVYTALMRNEQAYLRSMIALVHPDMSVSEIKMYTERGSEVVFHNDGNQERLIRNSDGGVILDWELSDDKLIITDAKRLK